MLPKKLERNCNRDKFARATLLKGWLWQLYSILNLIALAVAKIRIGAKKIKIANKKLSEEKNKSGASTEIAVLAKIIIGIVRGKTKITKSELFELVDKIKAEHRLAISLIKRLLVIAIRIKLIKISLFNLSIIAAKGKVIIKIKQEISQLANILMAIIKEKLWPEINNCSNQPSSKSFFKKLLVWSRIEKIKQNQIADTAMLWLV
jgi:hypothetical protein